MTQLDRHIFRHVLLTTLVVLLVFMALINMFALLDELRGDYTFQDAAWYTLLTTPRRTVELLPYVVFLGALIGLGNLASNSEIVVMRTSGVSVMRLFLSVCIPGMVVIALGMSVGEYVAPPLEEEAEAYKTRVRYDSENISLSGGYWYREGEMYMNVEAVSQSGYLLNIRQFWRGNNVLRVVQAATARYVDGQDGYWLLEDGSESHISDTSVETERFDEMRWNGRVSPEMLSERVLVDPPKLGINALYQQIQYMQREGLNSMAYQVAFFSKTFLPLGILGLCLLALAFVLGPMREVGMGVRLSIGVIAGIVFKYLQDLFAPMAQVYELHPAIAVLIPIVACWMAGWYGIRRFAGG